MRNEHVEFVVRRGLTDIHLVDWPMDLPIIFSLDTLKGEDIDKIHAVIESLYDYEDEKGRQLAYFACVPLDDSKGFAFEFSYADRNSKYHFMRCKKRYEELKRGESIIDVFQECLKLAPIEKT